MKKTAKKVAQSILIAIVTVIIWIIVVMNTGLYDALNFKRLILLAGIVLIIRLWFIGWNETDANQLLSAPSNEGVNNPDKERTVTSNPPSILPNAPVVRKYDNMGDNKGSTNHGDVFLAIIGIAALWFLVQLVLKVFVHAIMGH